MNNSLFIQLHSRAIRFWHWSTFIITGLILFTVFTDKTFLNRFHTASVIYESLMKAGINISQEQSFHLAEDLGSNVWKWHIRYGKILSALFAFRVIIELFQPGNQRITFRIKNALALIKIKAERKSALHYLVTRLIYLLFYGLLGTITGTGLWLSYHRPPLDVEQFHAVKQVHEACFTFILLFIFVHIGGILLAERRTHKNLVSGMIHGGSETSIKKM